MATKKKPGMLKRLFSSKKLDVSELTEEDKKKFQRSKSMDASMMRQTRLSESEDAPAINKGKKSSVGGEPSAGPSKAATEKAREAARARQNGQKPKGRGNAITSDSDTGKRRTKAKGKKKAAVHVTVDDPMDFPCTPEIILEHHKMNPFLNPTEEWLVVELGEFECLIDNMEIIKVMAKHSKFFEVEPDELVEEFFEFVDDVPSYDEVVNYDVWQEFRDKKYLC